MAQLRSALPVLGKETGVWPAHGPAEEGDGQQSFLMLLRRPRWPGLSCSGQRELGLARQWRWLREWGPLGLGFFPGVCFYRETAVDAEQETARAAGWLAATRPSSSAGARAERERNFPFSFENKNPISG